MKPRHSVHFSVAAGFVITAIVVVAAAMNLFPAESRSSQFWPRVLWVEFLAALTWTAGGGYLAVAGKTGDDRREESKVLPAATLMVFFYAGLSLAALLLHCLVSPNETAAKVHLAAQFLLGGGAAMLLVFLNFARSHAGLGIQADFQGIASPNDLCDLIAAEESRLGAMPEPGAWARCLAALRALRETMKYSLPQTTAILEQPAYRQFAQDISGVCGTVHACNDPKATLVTDCVGQIEALTAQTKTFASKSVRR